MKDPFPVVWVDERLKATWVLTADERCSKPVPKCPVLRLGRRTQ